MRFQEYAQNRNVAGGDHSYEGIPIFPCKSVTRGSHTHGKMVTRVTKILNFPVRLVTRGAYKWGSLISHDTGSTLNEAIKM